MANNFDHRLHDTDLGDIKFHTPIDYNQFIQSNIIHESAKNVIYNYQYTTSKNSTIKMAVKSRKHVDNFNLENFYNEVRILKRVANLPITYMHINNDTHINMYNPKIVRIIGYSVENQKALIFFERLEGAVTLYEFIR